MKMTKTQILSINKSLKSLLPAKIILFGSQAYGNANEDSDIDLLIIKKTVASKIKESNEARRALRDLRMPIDAIVVSEEEFDFYKNCPNSIYAEADRRGIVLYAK
jgi:uncharacterized protein